MKAKKASSNRPRPMRLDVRVTPRAKHQGIEQTPEGLWLIHVSAPPEDGRANAAVIKLLADHFGVSKSSVRLIRGLMSRQKTFEIIQ